MNLELTDDEALVLFELLSRYVQGTSPRTLGINEPSEHHALCALLAELERRLAAPFKPEYLATLAAARVRLEKQGGSW